jgi:hypothetical protein
MYALANDPKKVLTYNRDRLQKIGVMSEGGFVNWQGLSGLMLGGIGELYHVVDWLLRRQGLDYEQVRQEIRATT